jgi:hypothetical protein
VAKDVHLVLLADAVPAEPALSRPIEHLSEDIEVTEIPDKEIHILTTMLL